MSERDHLKVRRYRERQAADGQKQIQLWMNSELATALDTLVKQSGDFKNRSEAVSVAVSKFIEAHNQNTEMEKRA